MFCSTLYSVFDILLLCASDGLILHALVHRRPISALTRLAGRQVGHPACKNRVVGAGVVVCQEQGADLHMAQLMPLLLTVSCFRKIQIGFTFLVSADLGSPGQRAVKRVCVCVCVWDRCRKQCRNFPGLATPVRNTFYGCKTITESRPP